MRASSSSSASGGRKNSALISNCHSASSVSVLFISTFSHNGRSDGSALGTPTSSFGYQLEAKILQRQFVSNADTFYAGEKLRHLDIDMSLNPCKIEGGRGLLLPPFALLWG